jgi:hypothetical protein
MQQLQYNIRRPSALEELHRAAPPMDHTRSTLPSPRWSDATMCPTCGSWATHAISPGAGPYVASLTCHCGQRIQWFSKYQLKQYLLTQQALSQDWPTTIALAFQAALRHQKGGGR